MVAQDELKSWYTQGLQAVVAADEAGAKAAANGKDEGERSNIGELREGTAAMQEKHAATIRDLLEKAGGSPSGMANPAMDGIIEAIHHMTSSVGPDLQDAAGLAGGQLAFHYYIAAYGSLAATAKQLGMSDDAAALSSMIDDVRRQDERYTEAAERQSNKQDA